MENDHDHAAMTFRLDVGLRDDLAQLAREHDRSLAAELRVALRAHVRAQRDAAPTVGGVDRGASTTTVEGATA